MQIRGYYANQRRNCALIYNLWRAIDQDGDTIDMLVQKRRNKVAAKRFFRKLLRSEIEPPWRVITDKLELFSCAPRGVAFD